MITKEELLNELLDVDIVTCISSDDYEFQVAIGDYWLGGTPDGYICDLLGNIQYDTAEACVNAIFAYMGRNDMSIKEIY